MKKFLFPVCLVFFIACAVAFFPLQEGSIRGTVIPPEGAYNVVAFSATDTIKEAINMGNFQITGVKPGTYKVLIAAHAPYRNVVRDGIVIANGNVVDLGEIQLPR